MRLINESHEAIHQEHVNTINHVNDSLTQFHFDTDQKLQGIVATFETSLNDTEVTLEAVISKQEEIQTLTGAIVNDLKNHDMNITTIQSSLSSLDDRHGKDVSSIWSSVNSLESRQRNDIYSINSAINSSINSGMSSIRRDISSTKSDLSSTKSSLSYAKSDLSSTKSSLSSAKSDISSLRSRINTLEDKRVGFTARLMNKRDYKKNQIIVFNELESSYGGGYSTSTGVFTAPKTGLYLFQFNVEACTLENLHASLIARGNLRVSGMVDFGPNKAATNAAVAYLYRGDTAYVRVASLDSTYCIYPYRSSFTGVLID